MIARFGRLALLACGLAFVAFLVLEVGPSRVFDVLRRARRFLPWIVALEVGILCTDYAASTFLLPSDRSGQRTWIWMRAAALAYGSSVLLPAGRAAGEAVRALALAPTVGAARATRGCARLQACALLGNATASWACAGVAAGHGDAGVLRLALLGNGLLCTLLGGAILTAVEQRGVASSLARCVARFVTVPSDAIEAGARVSVVPAVAACVSGRAIQTVQYGVVLAAVGATFSPGAAFIAQGVHLVGASLGDCVPNQMGATEGAYEAFRRALQLGDAPARALSIALVIRVAQLGVAAMCLLVGLPKRYAPGAV